MPVRTDLARESAARAPHLSGISQDEREESGLNISRICVETKDAAEALGKPRGCYVTISSQEFSLQSSPEKFNERAAVISREISSLCGNISSALVVGLGNRNITPDRLGPAVADKIIATRHLKRLAKDIDTGGMAEVSVLAAGVMGQTGLEAAETAKAVVSIVNPDILIAVDALACCEYESLGSTIQLCDTGISPGSGVENARAEFSAETMGVPTVAIGVPTVMDAQALSDSPLYKGMFVTPRSIDTLIERTSSLIALALNLTLHKGLTAEEIISLW